MSKKKVLVIDNEYSLLRLSQLVLEKSGLIVDTALSVKDAKNILENSIKSEKIHDLIILDLMMPEENGFDFIDWMNKEAPQKIKNIPIIANTAKNLSNFEKSTLESNCCDILIKGINFTDNLIYKVSDFFS